MPDEDPIDLGPYLLTAQAGRGGMGLVWRGIHRATGAEVAVKVLAAGGPAAKYAAQEIVTTARLRHPAIVAVFDHGRVSQRAADRSGARLLPDWPYFVMEYTRYGSLLDRLSVPSAWEDVRSLLSQLLDALAHAHAKGIVHRDIKPGNVLFATAEGGIKLADFGIAWAWEGTPERAEDVIGSPVYMAPEQIQGRWREFGPWTDLYALGCLAWRLTAAQPPWPGKSMELMRGKLELPPGPYLPSVSVPAGFRRWLLGALAPAPADRYQSAAAARRELLQLPDPVQHRPVVRIERPEGDRPDIWSGLPLPERAPEAPPAPVARGIGLYHLRTVPLVGRAREREVLWSAAAEVGRERRAGAVVLRGPTGTGKSRLARWLGEELLERGAGALLRATHSERGAADDGIVPMLERVLHTEGLDGAELTRGVELALHRLGVPTDGAPALGSLLRRRGETDPAWVRDDAERFAVLGPLLRGLARAGPVVLWVDDAQWAGETLSLASHVLDAPDLPVLVVLTVRSDAPREPRVAAPLARLERRATRVEVGPMEGEDRQVFVRALAGLSEGVAQAVDERTSGIPAFAIQLVGDWVDRGLLVPGPEGYALARGAAVPLPDALHGVLAGRVERLLAGRPADDGPALELAALLGPVVDPAQWASGCEALGLRPSADLVDVLLAAQLADVEADLEGLGRWTFAHAVQVEALERRAGEAGRLAAHHRACAPLWEGRTGPEAAARRGRHLLRGGDWKPAVTALLEAARGFADLNELRAAQAAMDLWEEAVRALSLPAADPRRGAGRLEQGRLILMSGELSAASMWWEDTRRQALAHGWEEPYRRALHGLGEACRQRGDQEGASRWLGEAEGLARAAGDHRLLATTLDALGWTRLAAGRGEEAVACFQEAMDCWEELGDEASALFCQRWIGRTLLAEGDLEGAEALLLEARAGFERLQIRRGLASTANNLCELARSRGDLEAAARYAHEAVEAWSELGSHHLHLAQLNLALVSVDRGEPEVASEPLELALAGLRRRGMRHFVAAGHLTRALVRAALADWPGCVEDLREASALLAETGFTTAEVVSTADRIASLAATAGRAEVRSAAEALSADQRARLGDPR